MKKEFVSKVSKKVREVLMNFSDLDMRSKGIIFGVVHSDYAIYVDCTDGNLLIEPIAHNEHMLKMVKNVYTENILSKNFTGNKSEALDIRNRYFGSCGEFNNGGELPFRLFNNLNCNNTLRCALNYAIHNISQLVDKGLNVDSIIVMLLNNIVRLIPGMELNTLKLLVGDLNTTFHDNDHIVNLLYRIVDDLDTDDSILVKPYELSYEAHITDKDLDGMSCSVLAKVTNPDIVTIYASVREGSITQLILHNLLKYKSLLVTDIPLDKETADAIDRLLQDDKTLSILWVDHHKSNITKQWYMLIDDNNKTCATKYLYSILMESGNGVPLEVKNELARYHDYVEMVNDWDTFQWENDDEEKGRYLNELCNHYLEMTNNSYYDVTCILSNIATSENLLEIIMTNVDVKSRIEELSTRANECFATSIVKNLWNNYNVAICKCNLKDNISMIAHTILKCNNKIDIFIAVVEENDKTSLRTRRVNIDLTDLVKPYGGGGHAKASGCSYTKLKNIMGV